MRGDTRASSGYDHCAAKARRTCAPRETRGTWDPICPRSHLLEAQQLSHRPDYGRPGTGFCRWRAAARPKPAGSAGCFVPSAAESTRRRRRPFTSGCPRYTACPRGGPPTLSRCTPLSSPSHLEWQNRCRPQPLAHFVLVALLVQCCRSPQFPTFGAGAMGMLASCFGLALRAVR